MSDPARPVAPSERILALDVIRGAAVLGILVMNIPFFALPEGATVHAVRAGGADRRTPDEDQQEALEWRRERESEWAPSREDMDEEVAARRAGYASI